MVPYKTALANNDYHGIDTRNGTPEIGQQEERTAKEDNMEKRKSARANRKVTNTPTG